MGRLDGKAAIVTGGAQGIGAAYVRALSREGASVAIADLLSGDALAEEVRNGGGRALAVKTDVSDPASVKALTDKCVSEFGAIDILVNNAAIFASLSFKPFLQISDEEWNKVMAVNVGGIFQCCKAVTPHMRAKGGGKIINISSGTVFLGSQMLLHYVTSKAAVIGLTRALARELGPDKICVNAIAPGFTESEGVKANASYGAEVRARVQGVRALARAQAPEDLVGALLFLASDASDFVTGQTLVVDGGHAMH